MEYKIITASNFDQLAKKVNKAIEEGWVPLGGVALDVGDEVFQDTVAQAMGFTWLRTGDQLGSFQVEKFEPVSEPEPVPTG